MSCCRPAVSGRPPARAFIQSSIPALRCIILRRPQAGRFNAAEQGASSGSGFLSFAAGKPTALYTGPPQRRSAPRRVCCMEKSVYLPPENACVGLLCGRSLRRSCRKWRERRISYRLGAHADLRALRAWRQGRGERLAACRTPRMGRRPACLLRQCGAAPAAARDAGEIGGKPALRHARRERRQAAAENYARSCPLTA